MTNAQVIQLVETLNDVIQADDEQRVIAYGTRYREIAGMVSQRILEELQKGDSLS